MRKERQVARVANVFGFLPGLDLQNLGGLVVTGNVIDSRLKNTVGSSVVFGKDKVDEQGRHRCELEAASWNKLQPQAANGRSAVPAWASMTGCKTIEGRRSAR